jgi:hypothetical protein
MLIWETNMSAKAEVWQGTLALMVLKTSTPWHASTGTASRAASSKPAMICCSSTMARSTLFFSGSNRKAP